MSERNIILTKGQVTRIERNDKFRHCSFVIWFTGLSGSGKSTLSQALEKYLFNHGCHPYVIDGDNIRHGLCADLSFSPKDRHENIRRVSEVSKLMIDAGLIVLTAFISPYEKDRTLAKKLIGDENFLEIFCNASLEVCEKRDVKGLYKKAREGLISNFTGINAPYEIPINPDLSINTFSLSVDESVNLIIQLLKDHHFIN
jgi:adenylylsulfate kinase